MQSMFYERAKDRAHALTLAGQPGARIIGGGTNLLDLVKGDVEHPARLIDISRIGLDQIVEQADGSLLLGSMARNSDTANHPLVRSRYPLLSQALLSGASPQLRNMASIGGNLMQRPRCGYFTDVAFDMCNKRIPGSGCGAREGVNRMHAILGHSPSCIAVNPSDMSVALAALDARILIASAHGERVVPIGEFHRLPGATPHIETTLQPGDMIVAVELPASPFALHAHYLKVRDRASYAFALVSVAAALDIDGGMVRGARLALGGVAHKPWRMTAAEAALTGKPLTEQSCRKAAELLTAGARGFKDNHFKIKLVQNAVVRALLLAEGRA